MPISIKLGTNHPWVKGILNCSDKGRGPLQMGNNYKDVKMGWGHFQKKISSPEPLGQNRSYLHESSLI
jgi:hypothetical protein